MNTQSIINDTSKRKHALIAAFGPFDSAQPRLEEKSLSTLAEEGKYLVLLRVMGPK